MQTVRLGRTGLNVSVAGLGTGGYSRVGQGQGLSFDQSVDIVKRALDLGVTIIDTSSFYDTEEIVGAAIKGKRDKIVISTKNLMVKKGSPLTGSDYLTAAEFKQAVDANLRRLGTDYIDIFHVHGVTDQQYPYCREELVPVLFKLRDEGKIRFLAVSERFYVEMEHQMLDIALDDNIWDVIMVGYNFINQSAARSIFPKVLKNDVGTLCIYAVRSHLASFEAAQKLVDAAIKSGEVDPESLDTNDPLGFLVSEGGATSLTNACYRYDRHTPGVDVVLTGTGKIGHIEENIRSINDPPLPPAVIERLRRTFGRVVSVSGD